MPANHESILQVRNLSKKFKRFVVFYNVSFDVSKGEIFGIAGPNGAGKTTLFNIIAGKLPATTGEIIFNGENVTRLRSHQVCHRGIARTFQISKVFSTLTVFENVKVGARFGLSWSDRRKSKDNINENINKIIKLLGLQERSECIAGSLDLYGKKLVMLAAALATRPKMLLLDEQIAGLSSEERADCIRVIKKINEELGITIIIVEHLMKVLVELCNRLMILNEGQVVCTGHPRQVVEDTKVIEVYLS